MASSKNTSRKQPYYNVFLQNTAKINWYDAIGTINPFKQLKCALELKLSTFKIIENC